METVEKLSSIGYWDNVLKNAKLPFLVKRSHYSTWLLDRFFSTELKNGNYQTLMEVGAGSSAWLPFLAKEYQLSVSCLDYSEVGCRLCEENLKFQNIEYQDILCQDLLEWTDDKVYDVMITFGVIEHFDQPEIVVEICKKHLKPGGLIITVVPNISGLPGWITKTFLRDVYDMHKNISLDELVSYHEKLGFITKKANYTGLLYPMVIPWSSVSKGVFKISWIKKALLMVMTFLNIAITKFLVLIKADGSYKNLSPFLVYIGKNYEK